MRFHGVHTRTRAVLSDYPEMRQMLTCLTRSRRRSTLVIVRFAGLSRRLAPSRIGHICCSLAGGGYLAKGSVTKRDLVKAGRKFYAKWDANGRFTQMDRVSRANAADRCTAAKRKVRAGHGDQGDRKK